jgi:TolB protein
MPAWSPDGTKIAYVHAPEEMEGLFVMYADGTHQTRLTSPESYEDPAVRHPTWSHDGHTLAFTSGTDLYSLQVPDTLP